MAPEIAVVVASHDRPLRLRWLLEALADQTLARDRFEVVVAHDSSGPETDAAPAQTTRSPRDGALRHVALRAPGSSPRGAKRNAAWRAARAPIVAFTDDDCRPPARVARQRRCAPRERAPRRRSSRAPRVPDPDEQPPALRAVHAQRSDIDAARRPGPRPATSSTRAPLLERLGGFDEAPPLAAGEDTALAAARPRARRATTSARPTCSPTTPSTPVPAAARPALAVALERPAAARQAAPGDAPPLPARPVLEADARVAAARAARGRARQRTSSRSLLLAAALGRARRCPATAPGTRDARLRALRQLPRAALAIDATEMAALAARQPAPPRAAAVTRVALLTPTYWPEVRRGTERFAHELGRGPHAARRRRHDRDQPPGPPGHRDRGRAARRSATGARPTGACAGACSRTT